MTLSTLMAGRLIAAAPRAGDEVVKVRLRGRALFERDAAPFLSKLATEKFAAGIDTTAGLLSGRQSGSSTG